MCKGDREGGWGKELWKLRGCKRERERERVCVCVFIGTSCVTCTHHVAMNTCT